MNKFHIKIHIEPKSLPKRLKNAQNKLSENPMAPLDSGEGFGKSDGLPGGAGRLSESPMG